MAASALTRIRARARAKTCRRGITLLEVLISMFVALVGLSGLAALFWLGGIEMSEGAKLDRAVSVARSAQRSLKIYGMLRPIQTCSAIVAPATTPTNVQVQTWLWPYNVSGSQTLGATIDGSGTTGGTTVQPVMPFSTTTFGTTTPPSVAWGNYTQGFAIDPIGVVANPTTTSVDSVPNPFVRGFPGVDATQNPPVAISYTPAATATLQSAPAAGTPCLSRITLQAYPQNTTGATYPQIATVAYTAGQADLVFRSADDLLLNTPNGDFPPTQFFSSSGRRQFQGDYSWLATVVPSFNTYEKNTTTGAITPIGDTNLVRVSIVVYYKRNAAISIDPTYATAPAERMVVVNHLAPIAPDGTAGPPPTGVAGGDIQIGCAYSSYLNVKPGQWIMLSQQHLALQSFYTGSAPSTTIKANVGYWYRWYKVVATGAIQPYTAGGTTTYYRNLTLSGPDWNPKGPATYASIFDGVVAVYEKEIELEQSGAPWAPN